MLGPHKMRQECEKTGGGTPFLFLCDETCSAVMDEAGAAPQQLCDEAGAAPQQLCGEAGATRPSVMR